MALPALRLRRAVSLSSIITKQRSLSYAIPSVSTLPSSSLATFNDRNPSLDIFQSRLVHLPFQSRHFRSSSLSLSSARSSFRDNNTSEEIGPDTILFEGCDYNHWLITMDFPKDPAPTREEMIETYLQTLAKVVGSYEEAKKRMYAFSTTTYQGFQCLVSEEMSEKFRGLPGVVFILPDSYIDPVNKEYGGDKYENGVITPRPPPIQYQRRSGRYGDRNRDFNRNRERGPMQNQQGNPGYVNQGLADGGSRSFGHQHNYQMPNQQVNPAPASQGPAYGDARNLGPNQTPSVQPNYSPGFGGDRRDPMPMSNTPGVRDSAPYSQGNYNQNQQGYYNPQGGQVPPEPRVYAGHNMTRAPSQGATQGQGAGGNYGYGQGSDGNYGQTPGSNYGRVTGGNYGQGFNYQQNHPGDEGDRRFSPMEQRDNLPGGQQNYGQMGQSGADRGRY